MQLALTGLLSTLGYFVASGFIYLTPQITFIKLQFMFIKHSSYLILEIHSSRVFFLSSDIFTYRKHLAVTYRKCRFEELDFRASTIDAIVMVLGNVTNKCT